MSNLQAFYTKILSLLHELEPMDNFFNQTRVPKASDKALIALTMIQWINLRNGNHINNLKIVVA